MKMHLVLLTYKKPLVYFLMKTPPDILSVFLGVTVRHSCSYSIARLYKRLCVIHKTFLSVVLNLLYTSGTFAQHLEYI